MRVESDAKPELGRIIWTLAPKSGPEASAAAAAAAGDGESGAEHPLDHVSGNAVEEERDEYDEQEEENDLEDQPAIVVPEDVADRLERIEEPDERRVRTPTPPQQQPVL